MKGKMKLYDELHNAATSRNNAVIKGEYESIVKDARDAAAKCDMYITRSSINEHVKEWLHEEGVTTEYVQGDPYDTREGSYYKISWSKPYSKNSTSGDYWRDR